jgi:hypothetical protein
LSGCRIRLSDKKQFYAALRQPVSCEPFGKGGRVVDEIIVGQSYQNGEYVNGTRGIEGIFLKTNYVAEFVLPSRQ